MAIGMSLHDLGCSGKFYIAGARCLTEPLDYSIPPYFYFDHFKPSTIIMNNSTLSSRRRVLLTSMAGFSVWPCIKPVIPVTGIVRLILGRISTYKGHQSAAETSAYHGVNLSRHKRWCGV